MSHMVIFQTPDGNPGYNQFETLDEAVRFVEKLRNEQSVETARMFALEEVKFDFKPYFKVNLDQPSVTAGSSTVPSSVVSTLASSVAPSPVVDDEVPSGPSNGPSAPPVTPPVSPAPAFAPLAPSGPPVSFGEPPSPPAPPVSDPDSPVGAEPATVGAPPPPTFMAPPAPAQTNSEEQPTTRRGLFGR
ncbi:MAG: hypothetical protein IT195_05380 [Microthrixaceae bacterium]|nr:hypothetical protein [Microthrixaceae bacterium]